MNRQLAFDTGHGEVSVLLQLPDNADALLVLGHGAGADMRHAHMESIAEALGEQRIATFRFNFPFKEAGRNRPDSLPVCLDTISAAIETASAQSELPLLLGGHSFGGRMASHFVATHPQSAVTALIYFSFPLHPAKKPGTSRAEHLPDIRIPQLFLSGTRDALAELPLLREVVGSLDGATLHEIETGDHSLKILKRTRTSTEDVYEESARVARAWVDGLLSD